MMESSVLGGPDTGVIGRSHRENNGRGAEELMAVIVAANIRCFANTLMPAN